MSEANAEPMVNQNGVRLSPNGMLHTTPSDSQVAIYSRNRTESPLLRLPPELRNRIFELALSGYVSGLNPARFHFSYYTSLFPSNIMKPAALPHVCRQLYCETAALPFRVNDFVLIYGDHLHYVDKPHPQEYFFASLLPFQKEGISSITIKCTDHWYSQLSRNSIYLINRLKTFANLKAITLVPARHFSTGDDLKFLADEYAEEKAALLEKIVKDEMGDGVKVVLIMPPRMSLKYFLRSRRRVIQY